MSTTTTASRCATRRRSARRVTPGDPASGRAGAGGDPAAARKRDEALAEHRATLRANPAWEERPRRISESLARLAKVDAPKAGEVLDAWRKVQPAATGGSRPTARDDDLCFVDRWRPSSPRALDTPARAEETHATVTYAEDVDRQGAVGGASANRKEGAMRGLYRCLVVVGCAVGMLAAVPVASADHRSDPRTKNLHPLGHIVEPAVLGGFGGGNPDINTDIAFWGQYAFQGNWDGFSIRDISAPGNPRTVSRTFCDGNQGDIVVYDNILVRAWNTAAGSPGPFGAGLTCDGQPVPAGFEGVHVFDISNLADPVLVADIELSARPQADTFGCGSHTVTLAPDLANDRVIVYNQTSGGPCPFISILEVPLDNPAAARWLRNEPLEEAGATHDTGVILGDVNLLASAAHDHTNVYSIGAPRGGSLTDPEFLYTISEPGVCNVPASVDPNPERPCNGNWHSASFTWDGETIILGWEPGGGLQPECEASDPAVKKSFFFYDADNGSKLGQWTLPRPQGAQENCTLHNYNLVPLRSGRDVLVSGNYQAGVWAIDITDPANARTLAWSDPPPVPAPPGLGNPPIFCSNTGGCPLTGSWSAHWYNNFIYESHIGEGLNVFRLSGRETGGAMRLSHLNPQTQEFSLPR